MSFDFDPLVSPEQPMDPIEALLKTRRDKSSSNDDTVIAASSNELSDIRSMLMDLSRNLLTRMTIIEQKIDEHRQLIQRIDHLLTQTVLSSLINSTDIIHETSSTNTDPRIWTKLESIRTNLRSTQVQQQMEMKDLMEIWSFFFHTSIYWRVCMCACARVVRFRFLVSICTVPSLSTFFKSLSLFLSLFLFYDHPACWQHCKYEVIHRKEKRRFLYVSIIDRINQIPRRNKARSSLNSTLHNLIMLFANRVHS